MQWGTLLDFSIRILGAYIMIGGICGCFITARMWLDQQCYPRFVIRTAWDGILFAVAIAICWPVLFRIRNN